ncbi:MAG TPA: efflux RND transporter periplasmic adaptor subunit [Gemmatimonadales bacterium]|nr:efflux RND transporter periplasmic adaptor subunit [Gemmatimonadales bacterium]
MSLVHRVRSPLALAALAALGLATGCRRDPDANAEQPTGSVTILGPESVVVLDSVTLKSGPAISGTLMAEREARVRAQVAGTVMATYPEQGQRVTQGAVLARIDDRAVRDAYFSARSQVRSAQLAQEVAKRNLERSETLARAGAIADRDLETATWNATNADAQLADAKARLASAEQELQYTTVRAPFAGVVSERSASAGDVVQTGGALYTIIDPASLRFDGTVPAEQVGQLERGASVEFAVSGYPGKVFNGKLDRINPTADPATRQVRVYVSVPNPDQRLVAGLYAEGRVGTAVRRAVVAPASAVDQRGVTPTVLRIRQGRVEQVTVQLGARDEADDRIELRAGVAAGDTLLLSNAAGVLPGAAVRVSGGEASEQEVNSEK